MRIGLDARLAGHQHGGIGRYTEELLRNLLDLKTKHEWVVFLFEKGQLPWLEKRNDVEIVYASVKHYTVAEQLKLPNLFNDARLDLLHVPHFNVPIGYGKPYVVTIHDLLWHERRDKNATTLTPFMHTIKYQAYRFISEAAIRAAKAVFVPTEFVAKVVQGVSRKQRVIVTKEGVSKDYVLKGSKTKRSYPYLVYTGSLYPHKNVPYILDMLMSMQELHLIVVSGRSVFQTSFMKEVKKRQLEDRVHLEQGLEDKKVAELYRSADAFVMPSFSEGFGLPGLEAMACGTLVLASDIPVFHEVYGEAAAYINPKDPSSAVRMLTTLINHEDQRRALLLNAKKTVEMYSWKKMTEKTLQVYESLATTI
jgi:glycosyltransferase involved in cell wall biosynthesis